MGVKRKRDDSQRTHLEWRGRAAAVSVMAAGAASCACSTLIRSDDADFESPVSRACGLLGEPIQFTPEAPTTSGLFGAVLAASGDTLVVSALLERNAEAAAASGAADLEYCGPPDRSPERTVGAGAIRVYEGATKPAPPAAEFRHASDSPALLYNEQVPGIMADGIFSTHPVAVSDSWLTIGEAGEAGFRGSVRWFQRDGDGWTPRKPDLALPGADVKELYGFALALSGDMLVVGAPGQHRGVTEVGAAFVYELTADGAAFVTELGPGAPRATGWFGAAIAVSSDWLLVSAPGDDSGPHRDDGVVYAFRRRGNAVDPAPQEIRPPDRPGFFGASLAIDGRWLAAGTPGALGTDGTLLSGVVHLYHEDDSGLWQHVRTLDVEGEPGTLFGWNVALRPGALLVTFPFASGIPSAPIPESAGALHVFERDDAGIVGDRCRINAPNPRPCDAFGTAMAMGSGFVAVGAPYRDQLLDSGAVYVFPLSGAARTNR